MTVEKIVRIALRLAKRRGYGEPSELEYIPSGYRTMVEGTAFEYTHGRVWGRFERGGWRLIYYVKEKAEE